MVQADLETARADGQDLEAQLAAEVEAKSTLEKARAAAVQVRRPVTSLLLQLGHKPEPSRTALSMGWSGPSGTCSTRYCQAVLVSLECLP